MGISGAGRRNERRKLLGASGKEEKVKSGLLGDHGFYLRQELFNLLGLSSACLVGLLNDPTFFLSKPYKPRQSSKRISCDSFFKMMYKYYIIA